MISSQKQAGALILPATAMVVLFLCLPLVLLFRFSLNRFVPGEFMVEALTLENYARFVSDPYYTSALLTTVVMAIGVTALCLVLTFPIAMYMKRASARTKSLLVLLVFLPLFVGNAVRAAGWMVAFGQQGVVNYVLVGLGIVDAPLTIMYSPTAVFFGILSINLPFAVLTLQSVLEGIDDNASDAAMSLGATPFEAWRLVVLPLAMPGVLAAGVLSFILTMNAYATPVLLGGPQFRMMAPIVASEVLDQANWPSGAAVSFSLMGTTLILTILINGYVARRYAYQR
ncbi:ABC transporter permease [Salinarimonas rosea]|uniref:ABC transporter permease n=1 Tax=Salinarimonas rosea TaxID=552063 RepID=UPI00041243C3|nr:ABC transporter permease [Salinarimonas rosea]